MTTELLSPSVAAQRLHELLPHKTVAQWGRWLQNNRDQNRAVAYRIPFERLSSGVVYRPESLREYSDYENQRRIGNRRLTAQEKEVLKAYGVGEPSGGATGRKLDIGGINVHLDDATQMPYIQMIVNEPLLVFRVEVSQAEAILKELQDAVDYCNGHVPSRPVSRRIVVE